MDLAPNLSSSPLVAPPITSTTETQIRSNEADLHAVAKLATPPERAFETPSGVVTGKLTPVRVSDLSTDPRFKVREIRKEFVRPSLRQRYLEALLEGEKFPPLVVWREGARLVVLAGHHRLAAYQWQRKNYTGDSAWKQNLKRNPQSKAKSKAPGECDVYVVQCSEAEAKHIARSENSTHGASLTNREKHAVFLKIYTDSYYESCRSDRYFAGMLGVTHGTIQNWRKQKKTGGKTLISARELYERCLAMFKRGVDCAAANRELTDEQLKVIAYVEDVCHKAQHGSRTGVAARAINRPAKSTKSKVQARSRSGR